METTVANKAQDPSVTEQQFQLLLRHLQVMIAIDSRHPDRVRMDVPLRGYRRTRGCCAGMTVVCTSPSRSRTVGAQRN